MLEKFTFSSLPSFLLRDGKIPSQRVHLQFARRKNRKKEAKNKTRKTSNFCRIPDDLHLILPLSTYRMTAECDYFCFRKILKEIFPVPSAGTDILRNVSFGCFCTVLEVRGSFAVNTFKVV